MKIFSGQSNLPLATLVCQNLGLEIGKVELKTFPSGEKHCRYDENIRGTDTFIFQSGNHPTNDNLMELLVMVDAAKRASAKRITAVMPYGFYTRQDRKDKSRVPISAKLVMDMLQISGVNRILTMDLHSPQIVGFTNLPVDQLGFKPALINAVKDIGIDAIVAPDIGAVKRADEYATALGTDLVIISKNRKTATSVELKHFIGDVKGKKVLIADDLSESAGTLIEAAVACRERDASEVYCAITHGCFTEIGYDRFCDAFKSKLISHLFVSTTVNACRNRRSQWDYTEIGIHPITGRWHKDWNSDEQVTYVDVSPLFAYAIKSIHDNESVSKLF